MVLLLGLMLISNTSLKARHHVRLAWCRALIVSYVSGASGTSTALRVPTPSACGSRHPEAARQPALWPWQTQAPGRRTSGSHCTRPCRGFVRGGLTPCSGPAAPVGPALAEPRLTALPGRQSRAVSLWVYLEAAAATPSFLDTTELTSHSYHDKD